MGNKKDGHNSKQSNENFAIYGEDGLEKYGNDDAKKLAQTYKELSKDGLSDAEKQKLKKLDEALKGAEFHCLGTEVTLVTQHENNKETDFLVLGHGTNQNAGFMNGKPGRNK